MTRDEALRFLRAHQPLPSDDALALYPELGRSLLTQFDEARKHFEAHPDPECLPLLLRACGDKSGFGVYQLVCCAFIPQPASVVVPHLVTALQSPHLGVRYQAAGLSALFPDDRLVAPLRQVYHQGDDDERSAALLALTRNTSLKARDALLIPRPDIDDDLVEWVDEYFGSPD
ncbi:HEAT repeat domain-containing protein [Deinococcus humi]|uniref:HEAT repeat protein n=1 Tax=Deinococcus humi TaxID=662880 RepID=A0A7W8NG14_9DEIO|nr:HEAT repeat domain-containing protein [Deinococcus humi]MBB5362492.1 HEAT repeat protein [Deinococcus humi]